MSTNRYSIWAVALVIAAASLAGLSMVRIPAFAGLAGGNAHVAESDAALAPRETTLDPRMSNLIGGYRPAEDYVGGSRPFSFRPIGGYRPADDFLGAPSASDLSSQAYLDYRRGERSGK